MADDLEKKRAEAEKLRQQIIDERTSRHNDAQATEAAVSTSAVDAEIERLKAELEAEKALTRAQGSANKRAAKVGNTAAVEEAKRAAESARLTAENIAGADNDDNKKKED